MIGMELVEGSADDDFDVNADDTKTLLDAPSKSSSPSSSSSIVGVNAHVPFHYSSCGIASLLINMALLGYILLHSSIVRPFSDNYDIDGIDDNVIHFFGNTYKSNVWLKKQEYVNSIFGQGKWIDAWTVPGYSLPFSDPCIQILHYKNGKCLDSYPSQGRRLFWKPTVGDLHPFSAETMCSMMNGRNVLIVGDSLNEEFFFSLLSTMWAQIIRPKKDKREPSFWETFRSDLDNRCQNFCLDPYPACDGPGVVFCGDYRNFTIGFSRDDYLMHEHPDRTNKTKIVESNWVQQIRKQNISLLVINTGAHYMEIHKELLNLNNSLTYLYRKFPGLSIMYRTSLAGHENCNDHFHSEPLQKPPIVYTQHPDWHWGDIAIRNFDIVNMLSHKFPQVLRFDVFNATSLRADSHPGSGNDCLHYCVPGVVDDWVIFFYNAFLMVTNEIHLTREEGTHQEIPTRKFSRFDLNGKYIKNKVASTIYHVINGSRHVYMNGTGPVEISGVVSVSDEDFLHIPAGAPIP